MYLSGRFYGRRGHIKYIINDFMCVLFYVQSVENILIGRAVSSIKRSKNDHRAVIN